MAIHSFIHSFFYRDVRDHDSSTTSDLRRDRQQFLTRIVLSLVLAHFNY